MSLVIPIANTQKAKVLNLFLTAKLQQFFLSLKLFKKDCHLFSVPQACLERNPPTRNFPVVVLSRIESLQDFSSNSQVPGCSFKCSSPTRSTCSVTWHQKGLPLKSLGINLQNLQGAWWISQAFCGCCIFGVQGPFLKDWQFLILDPWNFFLILIEVIPAVPVTPNKIMEPAWWW